MRLPILFAVAVLSGGTAAAQPHEKPTQSREAPAPSAGKEPTGTPSHELAATPAAVPKAAAAEAEGHAAAPKAEGRAPAAAATKAPAHPTPASPAPLGDVRSRIATAVAAVKAPQRRAPKPSVPPAAPRVTVRWPDQRMKVTWTPPEDRVLVVWPR